MSVNLISQNINNLNFLLSRYAAQTQAVTVLEDWAVQVNFTLMPSSRTSDQHTTGSSPSSAQSTDPLTMPDSEWNRIYNFNLQTNFTKYLTNNDLQKKLTDLRAIYSDIINLKQIGMSQSNRNIVGLEMTGSNRTANKPKVALFGGLHGRQPVGRELLWRLAQHLGEGML